MSRKFILAPAASAIKGAARIVGILGLTTLAFSTGARAQPASQQSGCLPAGTEVRLSNCDALIRANAQALSNALIARGNAYRESGKLDQAIQDLTLAINLSPYYAIPLPCMPSSASAPASAFDYRGLAFEAKGQIDLAKKDYLSAFRAAPAPTSFGKTSQQFVIERLTVLGSPPEVRPLPYSGPSRSPDERAAATSRPAC